MMRLQLLLTIGCLFSHLAVYADVAPMAFVGCWAGNVQPSRECRRGAFITSDQRQRENQSSTFALGARRGNKGPDMRNCKSTEELVGMAYANLHMMTPRDLSAFWTITAKLNRNKIAAPAQESVKQQLGTILDYTLDDIHSFGHRDVAQTTLGIAKIVKGTRNQRRHFNSRVYHPIFLGKGGERREFIFSKLAAASMSILSHCETRHLSNLIYAFGLAEYNLQYQDGSTLFGVLGEEAIPSIGKFIPQALSNIVWAYATSKELHPKLFNKVGDHIAQLGNLQTFKPQELSNIVWAYATSKELHPKLFKKVGDHIAQLDNLQSFKSQALSNIVWAYATASESNPKLLKKVGDHIAQLDNLQTFKPQELSNIVWAFATLDETHPKLFKKVGDHIVRLDNLQTFKPQALANIVWSYATAKESNPSLFQMVAKAAIEKQKEFTSQNIVNLLWAFAANGQLDQQLFKSLTPAAAALVGKYNCQDIANIAWAYAIASVAAPSLFNDDFINACVKKENEFTHREGLPQLHQWTLWQKELKSDIRLPVSLEKKCHDSFLSREPRPSALQNDVVTQLKAIGLEPEKEVLTESGYRIDAIVKVNGRKVAVEVDGPRHFISRMTRVPTGSTILKHRQVASLDKLRVVSVPYWEWDELKNSDNKQGYLRNLLGLVD